MNNPDDATSDPAAADLVAALKAADGNAQGAALELISALAAKGDAISFIAYQLRNACVPTPTGRGKWHPQMVKRVAEKAGLKIKYGRVA